MILHSAKNICNVVLVSVFVYFCSFVSFCSHIVLLLYDCNFLFAFTDLLLLFL